jgi:peptidoglycan biosynthesis protein MviN/MurJ (putative lipid II flippase)
VMRVVGASLVRYLGVSPSDRLRFRTLTWVPYFTAVITSVVAALRNPLGLPLVFESALPATAGAQCALLLLVYYVPRGTTPGANNQLVTRSYAWIIVSVILALVFILVLGPGVQLHR